MHPLIIRNATEAEHADIVEFNCAMALETEGKSLIRSVIDAGVMALLHEPSRGFYVVAQRDGVTVGALMVTNEWSDWRNGNFWWIQSVYVRPEARGQGVYRALYVHLQARAANEAGICGFRLYVERDNVRAQRTYEALGMTPTHYNIYEAMRPGVVFCNEVS